MTEKLGEAPLRIRLIEQHLHELETVNGVFAIETDRALAVTSERIMIVTGGGPRGWALSSIPVRLITDITLEPSSDQAVGTVRVSYTAPARRLPRNGDTRQITEVIDLCPEAVVDAQCIFDLINPRVVHEVASEPISPQDDAPATEPVEVVSGSALEASNPG
jgi:hypothetical protein